MKPVTKLARTPVNSEDLCREPLFAVKHVTGFICLLCFYFQRRTARHKPKRRRSDQLGMKAAPSANPRQNHFDIVIAENLSFFSLYRFLWAMSFGRHIKMDGVTMIMVLTGIC